MSTGPFRTVSFEAADGLSLYARDYGPTDDGRVPVLCLSGLTRNSADFEALAPWLGRRVICPDYRGRGRSQHAHDPASYRPDVELDDALTLLDQLGIERFAVIGTSRGGIIAMLMAGMVRERLQGVLFNDIGPVINVAGLWRIRAYLGRGELLADWTAAVAALKHINAPMPDLSPADWLAFARRIFRETPKGIVPDYDLRLAQAFPSAEAIARGPAPDLWPLFDRLAGLPVAVVRGSLSDLLSEDTVAEMGRRVPDLIAADIPGRGHVPFLDEPEARQVIAAWLARVG